MRDYAKQWKTGMRWAKEHPNKMNSLRENLELAKTTVYSDNFRSLVWLECSGRGDGKGWWDLKEKESGDEVVKSNIRHFQELGP